MVQGSYGYETFRFKIFWATPGGTSGSKVRIISIEILKIEINV